MGKKNRRKGGKSLPESKADRKERLQDRRERAEAEVEAEAQDDVNPGDNEPPRTFFEGDRVWFVSDESDGSNPNTYRGIVREVKGDSLDVVPLQSLIDGQEDTRWYIKHSYDNAFPDFCGMALRFDVGDRVLCITDRGWLPCTVEYHWPIYELRDTPRTAADVVPVYKCGQYAVPEDSDDYIMEHPSSFRYAEGDNIIFNPRFSIARGKAAKDLGADDTWRQGTVTQVDKTSRTGHFLYECSFISKGKSLSCHILQDIDECISHNLAEPRARVLESIAQDCSREHLAFLVTSFSIDASAFRDLILEKAIEFGSYEALLWLQEDCEVDMFEIRDNAGNNLLHRMAQSEYAARFVRKLALNVFCNSPFLGLEFCRKRDRPSMMDECNLEGDTWLHVLVKRGNVKAFDAALTIHGKWAWETMTRSVLDTDTIASLKDCVKRQGNWYMQIILDTFLSFRAIRMLQHGIDINTFESETALLARDEMALFRGEHAARIAKQFLRFIADWESTSYMRFDDTLSKIVEHGYHSLFHLLYNADKTWFWKGQYPLHSREDGNEYIQPEICTTYEEGRRPLSHLLIICMTGDRTYKPSEGDIAVKRKYHQRVMFHFRTFYQHHATDQPLLTFLKKELERLKYNFELELILKYKISCLEDDKALGGRLNILSRVLQDFPNLQLDVLLPIRFRQCGVLRWMVEKKLVDLDADASKIETINRASSSFQFTSCGKDTPSMSLGTFLCFASIEYDDLSSLQWLCQYHGYPERACGGLNALHLASLLGRLEIVGWMCTTPSWKDIAQASCAYKPFVGAFAVHIAAGQGHINVADLLLNLGAQEHDSSGRLPDFYARKAPMKKILPKTHSDFSFARDWAKSRKEERERPKGLEKNIEILLHLLAEKNSTQPLMEHIITSKCLNIEPWNEYGCHHFTDRGPMGFSYGNIVDTCMKDQDVAFAEWLCIVILQPGDHYCYLYEHFWQQEPGFPRDTLCQSDLLSAARINDDKILVEMLSRKYTKEISCQDPAELNFLSLPALSRSTLSSRLTYYLIRVRTLIEIGWVIKSIDIPRHISTGGSPQTIQELMELYNDVQREVKRIGSFSSDQLENCWQLRMLFETDKVLEMGTELSHLDYDSRPLRKMSSYYGKSRFALSCIYITIATEGYSELVDFCLEHVQGWSANMELDMVRIASFMGHSSIIDIFLYRKNALDRNLFHSTVSDRYHSAAMGAAEAGHHQDLLHYSLHSPGTRFSDPIKEHMQDKAHKINDASEDELTELDVDGMAEHLTEDNLVELLRSKSIAVATVSGYIKGNFSELSPISILVEKLNYSHEEVLYAIEFSLNARRYYPDGAHCILRSLNLLNEFDISLMQHERHVRSLAKIIAEFTRQSTSVIPDNFYQPLVDWLGSLIKWVDIQDLDVSRYFVEKNQNELRTFVSQVCKLKDRQRQYWSQFDVVKKGTLAQIGGSIESGALAIDGRDRGGLLLTHLAVAFDRVDVLEWLIVVKGMDLNSLDGRGRTPLQVAEASKATYAYKWITEFKAKKIISDFVMRHREHVRAARQRQRIRLMATTIQKMFRGVIVRRVYRGPLLSRLEDSQRFQAIWGELIRSFPDHAPELTGWSNVRANLSDISRARIFDDEDYAATNEKLNQALAGAVQESINDIEDQNKMEEEARIAIDEVEVTSRCQQSNNQWSDFQITSHVVKFLKKGDPKYRSFFIRRMKQLANGDRSRILQKRLKGSKATIYESYLEQKSGFRILWTEEGNTIVIWFIAKHKSVSRLMTLIDDAKSRSARQNMPKSLLTHSHHAESQVASAEPQNEILLDVGNAPLKLYDLSCHCLDDVTKASWTPQLHLTDEERGIVEAEGTVLLLGRSGTGKTICICNRIEFDRQRFGQDPSFSQLFVSRSSKLCRYVKEAAGGCAEQKDQQLFMTFQDLITRLDTSLPKLESNRRFARSGRVDFYRFEREFYHGKRSNRGKPNALVVWKTIRSFMKGSIEAFTSPDRILSREDFLTPEKLGKHRCRIADDRETIYDLFLEYQSYIQSQGLWDDCDRVVELLVRFEKAKAGDVSAYESLRHSKVYVDEIQDYSQVECLLYFYLGGPGGLFLAGDPAQSVIEGTDFRFEEVRSVGYYVAGSNRRDLIPRKPFSVTVNFRSHTGILNVAADILGYLFQHFPQSAKQLGIDHGLFHGPRPGVCHIPYKQLSALLRKKLNGVVVLTHDDSSLRWKRILDYPLVYGIREAKGLEFKSVILLDFFVELPSSLQRPWRDMVLNREGDDFDSRYPIVETLLKLLYTAVTRCIERLYFVETSTSIASDATVRWLTTTTTKKREVRLTDVALATPINVSNLESMSMTFDEWISSGIDNAEMAEASDIDLESALSLIDRSVYCFEQSKNAGLSAMARTHRISIQFRSRLDRLDSPSSLSERDLAVAEAEASQLLATLIHEHLLREALHLMKTIMPLLSPFAQNELKKGLTSKLEMVEF